MLPSVPQTRVPEHAERREASIVSQRPHSAAEHAPAPPALGHAGATHNRSSMRNTSCRNYFAGGKTAHELGCGRPGLSTRGAPVYRDKHEGLCCTQMTGAPQHSAEIAAKAAVMVSRLQPKPQEPPRARHDSPRAGSKHTPHLTGCVATLPGRAATTALDMLLSKLTSVRTACTLKGVPQSHS